MRLSCGWSDGTPRDQKLREIAEVLDVTYEAALRRAVERAIAAGADDDAVAAMIAWGRETAARERDRFLREIEAEMLSSPVVH